MDFPMINEINENTNAAAEAVKTAILNAMPAAGIDQAALDAAVDEILAAMPTGGGLTSCIMKIQRGTVSFGEDAATKAVTLSGFSNLSKMFVILNGARTLDERASSPTATYISVQGQQAYLSALTVTKLTVGLEYYSSKYGSGAVVSYQVIEFY